MMEHSSLEQSTTELPSQPPSFSPTHLRPNSNPVSSVDAYSRGQIETTSPALDDVQVELDLKDARIRELEFRCEAYRSKERDHTQLEGINASLERRLDILTEELTRRPTEDSLQSPQHIDSSRPPSLEFRRRSTFPKLQIPFQSLPPSPEVGSGGESAKSYIDTVSPHRPHQESTSPSRNRQKRYSQRFSMQRTSDSAPSSSRPLSISFSPSLREAIWESPRRQPETSEPPNRAPKPMRKFASGLSTLKPLVLPSKTNRESLPLTAPIDIAFYTDPGVTSPEERPSTAEAREKALQALEGRSSGRMEDLMVMSGFSPGRTLQETTLEQKPLVIGLEPPSSAGTALERQIKIAEPPRISKWLSIDQWEPRHVCDHCVEPPLRKQLRQVWRVSVSLILGIEFLLRYGSDALIHAIQRDDIKNGDVMAPQPRMEPDRTKVEGKMNRQDSARTSKTMESNFDSGYDETM